VKLEKEKTLDFSLGFSWEMKEHEVLKFDESGIHELEEGERERESRCCCRGHLKMVCKVQLVQR
jgi:hypothetical protein